MKLPYFLLLISCAHLSSGQVRLPALVGDSMIVQRDTRLTFWGWASPGERITLSIDGKRYHTVASQAGSWSVGINPLKAGGSYSLRITGKNTLMINNILAGDVWLCSGQSNMVHSLFLHRDEYASELAGARNTFIRQFTIPTTAEVSGPARDLTGGAWKTATSANLGAFSVVGYFFAKEIYTRYKVPIGIINASVGGSPAEAWISEEGLFDFGNFQDVIQTNKDTAALRVAIRSAVAANALKIKNRPADRGLSEDQKWFEPTYTPHGWKAINVPGYWEDIGLKNLDGVVWFRKDVNVPNAFLNVPVRLNLGRLVDADEVYVNGKEIGRTTYQYPQRRYTIPPGVLKEGSNVITVRITNTGGKGGFVPDKPYSLVVGDHVIDLRGEWRYKIGAVFSPDDAGVPVTQLQNQPTALYNGMIAPFINYSIKGVLWYQGESNADRPREYRKLLPALVADWRAKWKKPSLPFLYVQLPNFQEMNFIPSESNWALLREAQAMSLAVPFTGMAVAIDLGEWNDIHPSRKGIIGERLALVARKVAYSENDPNLISPMFESVEHDGNRIIINFTNAENGLISKDGEPVKHFAIAGKDKKFKWARAEINGKKIVVWNDNIDSPVYVRYAWSDNPMDVNLYSSSGLPVAPFRTDTD